LEHSAAWHGSLVSLARQVFAFLANPSPASPLCLSITPLVVLIMAVSTQSTLENIERRRAQLQESVEKLQNALAHWTTWEAEYQMLSEEIERVDDASPDQIREIAKDLASTLLDAKEVEELLGKDANKKRTANQVVDMISRRIDYVQQNSATIEKQLDAAEKRLAGVDVLLDPGVENEEGLPMMDIEEELDEEGNEVGSSVNQTGKGAAKIVEALRNASLQKAEMVKKKAAGPVQEKTEAGASPSKPPSTVTSKVTEPTAKPQPELQTPSVIPNDSKPLKKSVSFADDTKPETVPSGATLATDGYNDALADMNFTHGTKVIELDEDDNEVASYPVIPQGESPEDAELRRQMLQYGLSEVGQIVAELNLDTPRVEYADNDDDEDWGEETEDEDDEDEWGRTTRPVVNDDYRKQMLELEKKLNARMMENVGPDGSNDSLEEHVNDVRTLKIRPDEQFDESLGATGVESIESGTKKKGVRFANTLDVSEAPQPVRNPAAHTPSATKSASTMSDTIIERPAVIPDVVQPPTKPAKVSRFKSARAEASQPRQMPPTPSIPEPPAVPTGPAGRTLANKILEHDASTIQPNAPDEFDPAMINREIQAEYNKARNRFIQQQDGFTPTEEDKESPMVEEKDGKTKKVSRFMAARLKGNGM
jgi:unconventional prefoldin RPB5 interactor 1